MVAFALLVAAPAPGAEDAYPDPAVEMWLEIKDANDPALLVAFVEAFPESPYAHAARARLKRLQSSVADPSADGGAVEERVPVRKRRRAR